MKHLFRKQEGVTSMLKSTNNKQIQWTPELIIQLIKEIVCAAMGLLLIAYTVYMVNNVLGMVGNTPKLNDAKDLLLLLLSLTGEVLGYYFGRVPADARASQAQKQATVATAHSYEISDIAKGVSDQITKMIEDMASADILHNWKNSTQKIIVDIAKLSGEGRKLSNQARMVPA